MPGAGAGGPNYNVYLQVATCVGQVHQVGQEQVQTDYLQAVLYLTCQSFWLTSGRVTLQVLALLFVLSVSPFLFFLFFSSSFSNYSEFFF